MLLLEDILIKIKNCIDVPYSLGYNLDEDDTDSVIDPVWDCLYEAGLNKECDIANGVSKVVIIPRNSAYVIKTPLFGSWYCPEEYDEENDEYYIDYENPYFDEYTGAYYEDAEIDCSNYCELEEYLYNFAVENGVSDMFAKTEFFGRAKCGRPVYISEKCKKFWWGDREPSDASKTIVKDKRDSRTPGWSRMDSMITALFVDDYGAERAEKLFQFLSDFDISDLHSDNVMISEKTGKIVITDYSGFSS